EAENSGRKLASTSVREPGKDSTSRSRKASLWGSNQWRSSTSRTSTSCSLRRSVTACSASNRRRIRTSGASLATGAAGSGTSRKSNSSGRRSARSGSRPRRRLLTFSRARSGSSASLTEKVVAEQREDRQQRDVLAVGDAGGPADGDPAGGGGTGELLTQPALPHPSLA